ncbi:hypothetical protein [Pseudomonas sp. HY7a-MNA-CIBAN-0227]|uniref:hypothetical protein n=1 Tax=Pseudomonas sp. HY7a-MNA-CIBAN-0227 TaxID=3140474 RepID=UPI00332F5ADF
MDAREYNEEFTNNAIRDYKNRYNEVRYMLAGDTDMLQEHHEWEEGETIADKIYEIYNSNQSANVYSGFSINQDFKVTYANDDAAYIVFEVSSNEKWIVGQNGDVSISYSGGIDRFEGLGWGHEDSEFFQAIASTTGLDFANMTLEISEDELDERRKVELDVDSAAEWLLQNADNTHSEVISFKAFVDCLEATGYNAHAAVTHALETTAFTKDAEWDDVVFGGKDFVADIERHIETIEKLKLQSDWEDVVSVFGLDDDDIVDFDADDFEDEIKAAFGDPENDKEPEIKKTRTRKPGM